MSANILITDFTFPDEHDELMSYLSSKIKCSALNGMCFLLLISSLAVRFFHLVADPILERTKLVVKKDGLGSFLAGNKNGRPTHNNNDDNNTAALTIAQSYSSGPTFT